MKNPFRKTIVTIIGSFSQWVKCWHCKKLSLATVQCTNDRIIREHKCKCGASITTKNWETVNYKP